MKIRKVLVLFGAVFLFSAIALAQVIGVIRITDTQWILDDVQVWFGGLPDAAVEYDTNQTNDSMVAGLAASSARLIVTTKTNMGTDFALAVAATPTLTLTSAGTSGSNSLSLTHDGTSGEISAGNDSVNYRDVNILELTQADLTSTCTAGQLKYDTGGATNELCYCKATNTWFCTAMAAGPTN